MTSSRLPRPFAVIVATGSGLVGLAMVALWIVPSLQGLSRSTALLSSFIPYGVIAWAFAALVLLVSARGRGRLVSIAPLVGLVANAAVFIPYLGLDHQAPAGTPVTLRVMTLNLHYGQADLSALLSQVQARQPDVLVLTEFTEANLAVTSDPAWTKALPYHVGTAGASGSGRNFGDPSGTQVFSRTPMTELGRTVGTVDTTLAVRLTVNGRELVLIGAHPVNPVRGGLDGWRSEGAILSRFVATYASEPLVVAGDLNAVPEHLTVSNVVATSGLHEASQGWQPTFPADRLVPLITIDHLLASKQFQTVGVQRFAVSGTDHLGSLFELAQS